MSGRKQINRQVEREVSFDHHHRSVNVESGKDRRDECVSGGLFLSTIEALGEGTGRHDSSSSGRHCFGNGSGVQVLVTGAAGDHQPRYVNFKHHHHLVR